MRIREKIKEIAKEAKANITIGTVILYDSVNNIADVYISSDLTLNNVPVFTIPGFHCSNLKADDRVYIIFTNNSMSHPKIICKADEIYAYNTRVNERHLRKGVLLVQQEKKEGEIITPSYKTWLDPENTNALKYGRFYDLNSIEDADEEMYSQGNFVGQDTGIYSPTTSSIVKVKENGIIDIFVETNIGIRINPKSKSIEILGNDLCTESNNWTVKSNNINIAAEDTLSVKAKKIKIEADEYEVGDK